MVAVKHEAFIYSVFHYFGQQTWFALRILLYQAT